MWKISFSLIQYSFFGSPFCMTVSGVVNINNVVWDALASGNGNVSYCGPHSCEKASHPVWCVSRDKSERLIFAFNRLSHAHEIQLSNIRQRKRRLSGSDSMRAWKLFSIETWFCHISIFSLFTLNKSGFFYNNATIFTKILGKTGEKRKQREVHWCNFRNADKGLDFVRSGYSFSHAAVQFTVCSAWFHKLLLSYRTVLVENGSRFEPIFLTGCDCEWSSHGWVVCIV